MVTVRKGSKKKGRSRKENIQAAEEQKREASQFLDRRTWLAAFSVAVLTFIVFLPALGNDFVNWDDPQFVYRNHHIMSFGYDFFRWSFTNRETQWSPLRWISHAIDYKLWGVNPMGHHLSSIILHSLNTLLVVLLVVKLFEAIRSKLSFSEKAEEERFWRRAVITGIVTGILFGIHPLRVESVVWISERKDVLYTFFSLLSIMCYLEYSASFRKKHRGLFYLACLSCFILAVMSKATAVSLPLVLILLDIYPLGRIEFRSAFSSWRKILVEKMPFLGISIAVTLINISVHEEMGTIESYNTLPLLDRILVAFKALSFYVMKMVWPTHLVPVYPYPENVSFFSPEYIGSFILAVAFTILCIFLWRKGKRLWLTTWVYYVITMLPVLIIKAYSGFAHDRYTYMPSIGPFLLIGLGISLMWDGTYLRRHFPSSGKKIANLAMILITIILSVLTVKQIKTWKNPITLWTHQIEIYPSNAFGYRSRADYYSNILNDYQKALGDLTLAIGCKPDDAVAYLFKGRAYMKLGDYQKAIMSFDKTIEIRPEFSIAYSDRCNVHLRAKNLQQAMKDCSIAIEIDPKNPVAYNNRGFVLFASGEFDKAIEDFSIAIALNPVDPGFYRNRGAVYSKVGKNSEAIKDYKKGARLGDEKIQEFLNKNGIEW
jgi:hypothetical protein